MAYCKICESKASILFEAQVLGKYNTTYFKCDRCGLIFIANPHWLDEAYKQAISNLDVGILKRNEIYAHKTARLITSDFATASKFLDYGGGYGLFCRFMRDLGYHYYTYDPYCRSIFSSYWEVDRSEIAKNNFDIISLFEVFEHIELPVELCKELIHFTDNICFSTQLIPSDSISDVNDWWYFSPKAGQHITFYTSKALNLLAERVGLNYYSDGQNFHVFSNKKIRYFEREEQINKKRNSVAVKILDNLKGAIVCDINHRRQSLIQEDYKYALSHFKPEIDTE